MHRGPGELGSGASRGAAAAHTASPGPGHPIQTWELGCGRGVSPCWQSTCGRSLGDNACRRLTALRSVLDGRVLRRQVEFCRVSLIQERRGANWSRKERFESLDKLENAGTSWGSFAGFMQPREVAKFQTSSPHLGLLTMHHAPTTTKVLLTSISTSHQRRYSARTLNL
jgi:hypothetical protein